MSTPPASSKLSTTKSKRSTKSWRRFFSLKRMLLVLLGLFVLGATTFGVAYARTDIPAPNEMANVQASIIYYADGKTEMDRLSAEGGNRESVPLSKIPLHVQRALLAAEDRTFYENNGVSPSGIARSVMVAVMGGPTQGGSTITQQYVKNYFLTLDRTVSRKAKEFIIAIKIDRQESKETILENYLNTIYYGRGAYGIQTAAKAYFGRDVSKLTVAQGALLASVIRGPRFYDPALGAEQTANARERVKYVLDGMVDQGWLTAQERAKTTFPGTARPPRTSKGGTVGYIIDEIKKELARTLQLADSDIDRGGLRIVTTIDKKAQDSAVKAVNENMPSEKDAKGLHVGLTAIKPGDGAVVAMYGGKDFRTEQFNSSTDATMQGGSTFKVFGLLAALQKDISTKTRYSGRSPQSFPEFADPASDVASERRGEVPNFGKKSYGRMDLREALADSVNTVFAQLNIDLADGGKTATGVRDAAILAGLPKACPPKSGPTNGCTLGLGTNMSNIFGTASTRVIEMANAFATIAAQGRRATPYLITKVTSANGDHDYQVKKQLTPAFDQKVTADVTDAMTRVVTAGTGKKARALGRPAAGKTGTTDGNKAVWFDGFTPQLAAAVGMYQPGPENREAGIKVKGIDEVTGGTLPTTIWTAFMKGALEGEKVIDFPSREGVGDDALPKPTTLPPTTEPPTSEPSTAEPPAATAPSTTEPPITLPPTPVPPRPEPTRPEPTRPEPTRPEPTKPEPTRPEPTRPQSTRPGPTRPAPTGPGLSKKGLPTVAPLVAPARTAPVQ